MKKHIKISKDDLSDGQIIKLLEQHRQEMFKHSPPGSVHALDLHALRSQDLTFWRADFDEHFAACGALKKLTPIHAELKSMKTHDDFLREGIARTLLITILGEAKLLGFERLSLETGSMKAFLPAQKLYKSLGFRECEPFGDYFEDINSVCMSLELSDLRNSSTAAFR